MEKGDIFMATDRANHPHPIIFLEHINSKKFKACIISSKSTNTNVRMSEDHFHIKDENGLDYRIVYNNSHLITCNIFEKETLWLSNNVVQGKLTNKGLEFIQQHVGEVELISHSSPMWELKQNKK